jgi:hypothetical protein
MNGTIVDASTYDEAIIKMQNCNTKNYWANEEEHGRWCVLFEDGIEVSVNSQTSSEASKRASEILKREDVLVGIYPSLPYFEKPKRRCCALTSYFS